ncbi:MAG TPA: class I SAM-dependent methyltransferase [Candidatus Acidoferrum sp.]|nr:class I SAM-dependent methyltransferase [Candidatus Acidoferrum sp.]
MVEASNKELITGPFGYSKASSRYEYDASTPRDKYDRSCILLDWVGDKKRVLEVGCSTGYMSREMKKRGCSVTGIEVDPVAAERAREYCESVHVLDLNAPDWAAGFSQREFDVVLLADVLEHLVMPDLILNQLTRFLAPDGTLVISLPNVVHCVTRLKILFGRFDYEAWGTLDHTHLRFFTPKTARALIEGAGYRIARSHPVIGGTMAGHARPAWRWLAHLAPGLFAYQMLFEAKKSNSSEK